MQKEFEKTVDRVLENCYDGHGQRNDCGVRRLKMEKNMKSKIVVDSSANVYELPDVGFACVPLKILTDEQEYVDTAEVDAPALAEMLRTYKGRTSTSCPKYLGLAHRLRGRRRGVCCNYYRYAVRCL